MSSESTRTSKQESSRAKRILEIGQIYRQLTFIQLLHMEGIIKILLKTRLWCIHHPQHSHHSSDRCLVKQILTLAVAGSMEKTHSFRKSLLFSTSSWNNAIDKEQVMQVRYYAIKETVTLLPRTVHAMLGMCQVQGREGRKAIAFIFSHYNCSNYTVGALNLHHSNLHQCWWSWNGYNFSMWPF